MSRAAYMAARHARLREESKCHDCATPIDVTTGVRCEACRLKSIDHNRAWRASPQGKRKMAQDRRRWRRKAKRRGLCYDCKRPAVPGRVRCEEHLAAGKARHALYLERKEKGIVLRERIATPIEIPVWQRVLRAAQRFDEFTNEDIREATGLSSNRVSVELGRLKRRGAIVLIRGGHGSVETAYRIAREDRRAA